MENGDDRISKSPKLVILTPTLDGGVGRVISLLIEGMNKRGVLIDVWTLKGGSYKKDVEKYSKIKFLSSSNARGTIRPLKKLLREEKPEKILSISFHINCMILLAKIFSKVETKIFISEHTSLDTGLKEVPFIKRIISKICIRLLYRKADGLIAISNGVAKYMAKYSNLPIESIKVIYNPVITKKMFEMSKVDINHPFFENEDPTVLAVGRLSPEKDYPTLLESIKIANEIKPINLIIIGDGPEKEKISKKITDLKLNNRVSLMGHVLNPYPYFVKSNLYVLSSTREGLPTALIEALALKTPVVSTDAKSGPREILKDGKYGMLVPAQNNKELAKAIIESVKEETVEIPEKAINKYLIDEAVENYLKLVFSNEK